MRLARMRLPAAACFAAACATALLPAGAEGAGEDPWLANLARELREDPLYVSDSVSRAVSPAEAARMREAIAAMPFAARVAILSGPPRNFDAGGVHGFELPDLLAGAIDRAGLYVVVDAGDPLGSLHAGSIGVRTGVPADDVERAVRQDVSPEARVATRIRYALRVAATGARPLRGRAERELHDDDESAISAEDAVSAGFAAGAGLAAFSFATLRWWRRRPRRPRRRPPRRPAVREPDADIAREAAYALARLSAAIAAAPAPSDEVFDLYAAAAKADREARTPVDHLGALLLARDGAAILAGRRLPQRCFFDPRHRGKTTGTRWRRGRAEAEVPACKRCARALRAGRMPDTLGDRGRPYFERGTVWARTGFGTIDGELAARMLSGR